MEKPEEVPAHPFPRRRPHVEISESEEPLDGVDHVELRWWLAVPRPGERTTRASYDADTLGLAWVVDVEAKGPATIHGVRCVEMRAEGWSAETGRKTDELVFYARVEEDSESRWLAVSPEEAGEGGPFTFLDGGFEDQWGQSSNPARRLG